MKIARALVVLALGCGAPPAASSSDATAAGAPKAAAAAPPRAPVSAARARPDEAAIYARLERGLVTCYEAGRKSVPTMLDGRLTMTASIDASGRTACVVPTGVSGLTRDVADCMSARFDAERFGEGPQATASVRVAVRGGKVEPDTRARENNLLESVETYRMPNAFDVLESLVPELQTCVHGLDPASGVRSVLVGARVAPDGRTQCAVASGWPSALPASAEECATRTFRRATFPPPAGGPGIILVPIALVGR